MVDPKVSITNAFITPILTSYWLNSEDFNQKLKNVILKHAKKFPGIQKSNVNGYHSEVDFIHKNEPLINELKNRILQGCRAMAEYYGLTKTAALEIKLAGWANIMTHGNYHRLHNHPDSHWSGVYYIDTGTPDPDQSPNGYLQFNDPRPGANRISSKSLELTPTYSVAPQSGLMVIFPSYLEHYVHPFFGVGERVSIAFNARLF